MDQRDLKIDQKLETMSTTFKRRLRRPERIVLRFYKAVETGDVRRAQAVVGEDLEWWFHGPPSECNLMRMLTGVDPLGSMAFQPMRVSAVDSRRVVAEGQHAGDGYWVHVWTVEKNGTVTQLGEYFNTGLTIIATTTTSTSTHADVLNKSLQNSSILWQSELSKTKGKLIPGLVLVI